MQANVLALPPGELPGGVDEEVVPPGVAEGGVTGV